MVYKLEISLRRFNVRETMRLVGYLYTSNMSLKPFQFLHLIENLDLFESLSKNYWYLVFGDWYLESVHLSKKYSGTSSLSERNLSQSCSTSSFLLVRTCSKWKRRKEWTETKTPGSSQPSPFSLPTKKKMLNMVPSARALCWGRWGSCRGPES